MNKLTRVITILILGCLAILAVFLWPYRNEIAHIAIIVMIVAAAGAVIYVFLRLAGVALPLIEYVADIRHKWILGNREKQISLFVMR